jgi:LysM repeat protein
MATKASFNASEWEMLKNAPYYVQAAINKAEGRMGLMEVRREASALKTYLSEYKGNNSLVKAVIAESASTPDLSSHKTAESVADVLGDIAEAVDSKTDEAEYDEFMDFLLGAGNAIADATSEGLLKRKDTISDEEEEALDLIAHALKATDGDKHDRATKSAAAQRAALVKQRQAQAKMAADKQKAAEAQKAIEEAEKKLKEAEAREEKRKAAADRQAQARDRRRERMAAKAAEDRQAAATQRRAERTEAAEAEAEAIEAAKTYTVMAGDSLWKIAEAKLGNGNRYMEIAKLNNIKNPSVIFPGTELQMPE